MGIIFAILIFSFLIFIHELGHFLAAKASHVQVNEFSMFMGPAIFKKKKGDTLYSLRCIPIGGYCAMEGEDADTDNPRSFQKAAWWKRLIILAAGSFMNFLAGYLMFAIFLSCAYPSYTTPQIDRFESCSTVCGESLLQEGDVLLQIDGENIYVTNSRGDNAPIIREGNFSLSVYNRNGLQFCGEYKTSLTTGYDGYQASGYYVGISSYDLIEIELS